MGEQGKGLESHDGGRRDELSRMIGLGGVLGDDLFGGGGERVLDSEDLDGNED